MEYTTTWAEEYLRMVSQYWEEGKYPEGRRILEAVFLEEPTNAQAHSYAGWYAQYQLKDKSLAIMHFEFALKFDPDYAHTYVQYAELLVENKNEPRLRALMNEGMKRSEVDKASLMSNYALILEMQGRFREASATYKEAMRHTMNYWILNQIKTHRRRARAKYNLFSAVYSTFM